MALRQEQRYNKLHLNKYIAEGISFYDEAPSYRFTKLNKIKPDMLKETTRNARIAASEFVQNAGIKVGSIQNASQASFTIVDAGASYGDTRKIEKDVRVVINVTFYLVE